MPGLLFCRGIAPHASYLFKHALVQDAAYRTLLRGRRQELHARVAAALEAAFRRSRRAPAGTARPSPDGCRRHRTRGRSMAEGRAACRRAIGPSRSDRPFRPRARGTGGTAGRPGSRRHGRSSCNWPAACHCSRPKVSLPSGRQRPIRALASLPSGGATRSNCSRPSTASGNRPPVSGRILAARRFSDQLLRLTAERSR